MVAPANQSVSGFFLFQVAVKRGGKDYRLALGSIVPTEQIPILPPKIESITSLHTKHPPNRNTWGKKRKEKDRMNERQKETNTQMERIHLKNSPGHHSSPVGSSVGKNPSEEIDTDGRRGKGERRKTNERN